MIGTTGATVLMIANLIVATVLGMAAGGLACLILRTPWGLKIAVVDAAVAAATAIVSAFVITSIDAALGISQSRVALLMVVAVASVIVRHLLRRTLRQANKERTLT